MKGMLIWAALLVAVVTSAQEKQAWKRFENNIQLGGGLFLESGKNASEQNPGLTVRISYGMDIRLNEQWSVMPGVGFTGFRGQLAERLKGGLGGFSHAGGLVDLFVSTRYHIVLNRSGIVLGLGPSLSYMALQKQYHLPSAPNEYDDDDKVNHKDVFNPITLGLMPSIILQHGKHFQWGLEANIGLTNAMRQYPETERYTGTVGLHYLTLACGWRF